MNAFAIVVGMLAITYVTWWVVDKLRGRDDDDDWPIGFA